MAGLIPQGFIENLRERTDLAELIGARITLKKAGSNYKACCPFHDERTPSFNVRPDKGFYHCFGCGAHGDAIAFLQEYENLSFTEAVESLAAHLGMDVPYDESAKENMRKAQSLTGALEQASHFYRQCLQQHPPARWPGITCSIGAWTPRPPSVSASAMRPRGRCARASRRQRDPGRPDCRQSRN